MKSYKLLLLIFTLIFGQSYGLYNNQEDKKYFKNLLNRLQNKKRLATRTTFFYDPFKFNLYSLLKKCGLKAVINHQPLPVRSEMCLAGQEELDDIMHEITLQNPNDERLSELRYLRSKSKLNFDTIKRSEVSDIDKVEEEVKKSVESFLRILNFAQETKLPDPAECLEKLKITWANRSQIN